MKPQPLATVALALALAAPVALPVGTAQAGSGAKFSIASYRLTMTAERPDTVSLEMRGRVSTYGREKTDFRWTVPDAHKWLPILNTCTNGSLMGEVNIGDQAAVSDRMVEGEGPILELSCRVILK